MPHDITILKGYDNFCDNAQCDMLQFITIDSKSFLSALKKKVYNVVYIHLFTVAKKNGKEGKSNIQ